MLRIKNMKKNLILYGETDLIRHKRIHTGEKPFVCKSCNRSFLTKSKLNIHDKVHTREGLIECKICKKTFSHTIFLRVHGRIHTGEKPVLSFKIPQESHENTLRAIMRLTLKSSFFAGYRSKWERKLKLISNTL